MAVLPYEFIAFALFALITVGSSLGVVLMEDVWHSALMLGVALLSAAVHYIMAQAPFIAAMQILVYVGGVLILITFAAMLTRGGDTAGDGTTTDDATASSGTVARDGGTATDDGTDADEEVAA